jgi:hypothetical protein
MDYSKPQASSSPSSMKPTIEEMMLPEPPPGWAPAPTPISQPSAQEVMPPLPWRHDDLLAAKIDRILAAVGKKIVPPNLNRIQLWDALRWRDIGIYQELIEFRSGHLWKNKAPELRELERLSSSARWGNWPLPLPWEELDRVQKWCRSMLAQLDQGWHPERWHPDFEGKSSIALLIGHILPKTFERHFGRPAATTPTGPYVRFVMAVLKEFNIKKSNGEDYKRGTIVSELNAVRNGHLRRKGHRGPQTTKPAEDIATFVPPHGVVPPF